MGVLQKERKTSVVHALLSKRGDPNLGVPSQRGRRWVPVARAMSSRCRGNQPLEYISFPVKAVTRRLLVETKNLTDQGFRNLNKMFQLPWGYDSLLFLLSN